MNNSNNKKYKIKGLNLQEIQEWIESIGEKPYRARQLYAWMYQKGVRSLGEMTNLSKKFRDRYKSYLEVSALSLNKKVVSKDQKTTKYLFNLNDRYSIESVYMIEGKRVTICLSTQVGCPIGCSYCATGLMGFRRNLTAGEIIDQFLWINSNESRPITNVVFMGMGEPFLNYDNTIKAAQILNSELGPEIAKRRITISTCGILPAMHRYTEERHGFKLAVSLNGSNDKQRSEMIPVNKKYPIKKILEAAMFYTQKMKKHITFEYVLIADFNDSDDDAKQLVKIISPIPCKLNIIPYNQNSYFPFRSPSEDRVNCFIEKVYKAPFTVTVRRSKGGEISAACGQLYT